MDIVTHILLGFNSSLLVDSTSNKIALILSSIIPDIGEIIIQKELNRKYGKKLGVYDERTSDLIIANNINVTFLYDLLHSPIIYISLLLSFFIFTSNFIFYFAIGGLLHFALDFSTHGSTWALKLFFPFSNKRFLVLARILGNWWEWKPTIKLACFNLPIVCIIIWILFAISAFLIWITRY